MATILCNVARGMLGPSLNSTPRFRTRHPVNLAAAVATHVSLVWGTVARADGSLDAAKTAGRRRLVAAERCDQSCFDSIQRNLH